MNPQIDHGIKYESFTIRRLAESSAFSLLNISENMHSEHVIGWGPLFCATSFLQVLLGGYFM